MTRAFKKIDADRNQLCLSSTQDGPDCRRMKAFLFAVLCVCAPVVYPTPGTVDAVGWNDRERAMRCCWSDCTDHCCFNTYTCIRKFVDHL